MQSMKKQASPTPTPRAAALSQSASRFSAGVTSAWQNIANKSPRLAAAGSREPGAARTAAPFAPPNAPGASRVALESQRVLHVEAPAAKPETIRQVGWREVDRAVGMSTKRKYSLLGIGFGPKVPVFETEKVKLPVYQETDRNKRYYAVVKAEEVDQVKWEGFRPEFGSNGASPAPKTVKQFNAQGSIHCFNSEAEARIYGQKDIDGDYAIIAFVMPEYQNFTMHPSELSNSTTVRITQTIPADCIWPTIVTVKSV